MAPAHYCFRLFLRHWVDRKRTKLRVDPFPWSRLSQRASQRLLPRSPHLRPSGPRCRCELGPDRWTAAAIFLLCNFQNPLPVSLHLGPSCSLCSRDPGPACARHATATSYWRSVVCRRLCSVAIASDGIDLALERLNLFLNGNDFTELTRC